MRVWIMCGCLLGLAWGGVPRALAAAAPVPPLCARGGGLQRAVLAALDAGGAGALDCAAVTGPQLAALRALGQTQPVVVTRATDLAGLVGLEALHLRFEGEAWPPAFLASTPRLHALTLDAGYLTALPPDLLAPVPQLTRFELHGAGGPEGLAALPPGLLAPVPRLTHLALRLELPPPYPPARQPLPTRLPPDFLAPVPQLTHLTLECAPPLPPDFLAPVPRLTHLTLCFGARNREPLAPAFLVPVPRLTHLTLDAFFALPPAFLAPVPRLTHLIGDAPPFPRALQYVPQLTHLELRWAGQSLASAPHLIQAQLRVPPGLSLPSAFLAYAPRLERLELYAPNAKALPSAFLAYAPRLERLELYAPDVSALPPDFLIRAPRLVHLDLHDLDIPHDLGIGPDGIGPWAPALTTIPDAFLADAPRLAYLNLPVRRLAQVPAPLRAHLQALATLAVVAAPAAPHVDFPAGDPGLCAAPTRRLSIETVYRNRHHFAAPLRIVLDCASARGGQPAPAPWPFSFRLWPHYAAFVSLRLALDCAGAPGSRPVPAPWPLCRPSQPFALPGAARPVVAWLDGLVPLRARPHAQSPVTGYAYRGDVVRVEARYAAGAWLRVRLVNPDYFPARLRFENGPLGFADNDFWLPAAAVQSWLPDDESLCPYCDDYRSLVGWG